MYNNLNLTVHKSTTPTSIRVSNIRTLLATYLGITFCTTDKNQHLSVDISEHHTLNTAKGHQS